MLIGSAYDLLKPWISQCTQKRRQTFQSVQLNAIKNIQSEEKSIYKIKEQKESENKKTTSN